MKKLRLRVLLAVLFVASMSLVSSDTPARATHGHTHKLPLRWWESYHRIGSGTNCGVTSGGHVKWWQSILWADHDYYQYGNMEQNKSQVDGYWGSRTQNATTIYQGSHALHKDGCVGYNTYLNATYFRHHQGYYNGTDNYYWQSWYPELIGMEYWNACWYFQWFDGLWMVSHWLNSGTCAYAHDGPGT